MEGFKRTLEGKVISFMRDKFDLGVVTVTVKTRKGEKDEFPWPSDITGNLAFAALRQAVLRQKVFYEHVVDWYVEPDCRGNPGSSAGSYYLKVLSGPLRNMEVKRRYG